MKIKMYKCATAINPIFPPAENKLHMVNIIHFNDPVSDDILAGRVTQIFNITRTVRLCILAFLFALLAYVPANAQTEYDEYDDYYEDSYESDDSYYNYDNRDKVKEEQKYRRSVREDQLYNGHYKRSSDYQASWGTEFRFGGINVRESGSSSGNIQKFNRGSDPSGSGYNTSSGPDRGTQANQGGDGPIGTSTFDPNEGKPTDDDGDQKTPPPPPDEPDVPVDTAIPFLIVAGIGLAGLKLYTNKKHQPAS